MPDFNLLTSVGICSLFFSFSFFIYNFFNSILILHVQFVSWSWKYIFMQHFKCVSVCVLACVWERECMWEGIKNYSEQSDYAVTESERPQDPASMLFMVVQWHLIHSDQCFIWPPQTRTLSEDECTIMLPSAVWLIDHLYSAILRSLEQTHCARLWFYMSVKLFIARFLNIHRSGVLTALAWLVPHETAAI